MERDQVWESLVLRFVSDEQIYILACFLAVKNLKQVWKVINDIKCKLKRMYELLFSSECEEFWELCVMRVDCQTWMLVKV